MWQFHNASATFDDRRGFKIYKNNTIMRMIIIKYSMMKRWSTKDDDDKNEALNLMFVLGAKTETYFEPAAVGSSKLQPTCKDVRGSFFHSRFSSFTYLHSQKIGGKTGSAGPAVQSHACVSLRQTYIKGRKFHMS
jgi:hypothetical protein